MKNFIFILFAILTFHTEKIYANGHISGQITYKYISGFTYQVTITTYMWAMSFSDRCDLYINWGDSTSDILPRVNGDAGLNINSDYCAHLGEIIVGDSTNPVIRKNIYTGIHTYPASASYIISMEDPNRDEGIINIPYSIDVPFYIESMIYVFDPTKYCVVNSIDFLSFFPYYFDLNNKSNKVNLTVFDLDHDSISYELVSCKGDEGIDIPGYSIPSGVSINPYNGEFSLPDSNITEGEYNIAVKINKWRDKINIGYVMKDFTFKAFPFYGISYSFIGMDSLLIDKNGNYYVNINPNDTLNLKISYIDADSTNKTSIHSFSELFLLKNPPSFSSDSLMNISKGYLKWIPKIENGRKQPYLFTFRGYTNDYNLIYQNDLSLFIYVKENDDTLCEAVPLKKYIPPPLPPTPQPILIFPNPVTEFLSIENVNQQNTMLLVYNIIGKLVLTQQLNDGDNMIDISGLSKGMYILNLESEIGKIKLKLIKI